MDLPRHMRWARPGVRKKDRAGALAASASHSPHPRIVTLSPHRCSALVTRKHGSPHAYRFVSERDTCLGDTCLGEPSCSDRPQRRSVQHRPRPQRLGKRRRRQVHLSLRPAAGTKARRGSDRMLRSQGALQQRCVR